MMKSVDMILASQSPRRRELFALTGWKYAVRSVDIDERNQGGSTPIEIVRSVAQAKLGAARNRFPEAKRILTADTVVVHEGHILGKPQDQDEAVAMLRDLRDCEHQVITALGCYSATTGSSWLESCCTRVPIRNVGDDEILAYVATGSPMDKAGGYGIQDGFFNPVPLTALQGCYANVMGLPLCTLARAAEKFDLQMDVDIAAVCQRHNQYNCSVYAQILRGEACEKYSS